MVNYEIQSFDLVFEISDKGRNLLGDLLDASTKAVDQVALKIAARHRFAPTEDLAPQLAEAQATIAQLTSQIQLLQLETAPDIAEIALALQAAGLAAWAERAITAADPDDGVLDLVLELYGVAKEARSLTQCDRVKSLFIQIGTLSGVWPTPEEAIAMQAILTTNNVGEKWLKFA